MRRFSAILALGTALLAVPAVADGQSGDSLRMLDQFMAARSAALRCGTAKPVTLAAFRSNYRDVALRARAELKSILTDLDDALIEKVIASHYDDMDRHMAAMIAQESCDGPHIRDALQHYDSGARMVPVRLATNK